MSAFSLTNADISFGGAVHLRYIADIETIDKFSPDIGAKSVAKHNSQRMSLIVGRLRLRQKVPTDFANVLGSLLNVKEVADY